MTDNDTMRVLEDGALERHIKAVGARCPFCGSIDIHSEDMAIISGKIYYDMECCICEGQWTDIYVFAGVRVLGEGLEKIFPDFRPFRAIVSCDDG